MISRDLRAELEWNRSCEAMEKLTDGPVGLGTKYRAKWKSSPHVELETLAFARLDDAQRRPDRGHLQLPARSCAAGDATACHLRATPHGWFRLIFPIFLVIIRREEKANMGHIHGAVVRRTLTLR